MEKGLERISEESLLCTRGNIIRWREARRYHFNAFVLAIGFASWLLVMTAGSSAVKPGQDFENRLRCLRLRHLHCDGERLLHVRMGCGHGLLPWDTADPTVQGRSDFFNRSHDAPLPSGCGRIAYYRLHRAKTRSTVGETSPLHSLTMEQPIFKIVRAPCKRNTGQRKKRVNKMEG